MRPMRRLLTPLRTPTRRAALVAAAVLLLLARYAPYQPRYSAPTRGHFPIGFSPDGRLFALHNKYLFTTLQEHELLFDGVFIHDLLAAGVPEQKGEVNLYDLNYADPPP